MSWRSSNINTCMYASGNIGKPPRSWDHDNREPPPRRWTPMFQCLQGVMDIQSEKPFYVYVANLTAKVVNQPKVLIVAPASNAAICIIHARLHEANKLKDEGPTQTKCHKFYSDPTVGAVRYRLLERRDGQVLGHNERKESDKVSKTDWR